VKVGTKLLRDKAVLFQVQKCDIFHTVSKRSLGYSFRDHWYLYQQLLANLLITAKHSSILNSSFLN